MVLSICFSLMMSDGEPLSMCLVAVRMCLTIFPRVTELVPSHHCSEYQLNCILRRTESPSPHLFRASMLSVISVNKQFGPLVAPFFFNAP